MFGWLKSWFSHDWVQVRRDEIAREFLCETLEVTEDFFRFWGIFEPDNAGKGWRAKEAALLEYIRTTKKSPFAGDEDLGMTILFLAMNNIPPVTVFEPSILVP